MGRQTLACCFVKQRQIQIQITYLGCTNLFVELALVYSRSRLDAFLPPGSPSSSPLAALALLNCRDPFVDSRPGSVVMREIEAAGSSCGAPCPSG